MRGDRPRCIKCFGFEVEFTPHARGSTVDEGPIKEVVFVYPACAGIDLVMRDRGMNPEGLPRMRGDRPSFLPLLSRIYPFTPHARGSTSYQQFSSPYFSVYPACAGIDLAPCTSYQGAEGLPRMRGDRPAYPLMATGLVPFTPHARGSTWSDGPTR